MITNHNLAIILKDEIISALRALVFSLLRWKVEALDCLSGCSSSLSNSPLAAITTLFKESTAIKIIRCPPLVYRVPGQIQIDN